MGAESGLVRRVSVPRNRLSAWLAGFAHRHGEPQTTAGPDRVRLDAPDGALAEVEIPFPPLQARTTGEATTGDLVAHVLRDRRVGVLLVRKGGHAVGVAVGDQLVESKVGSGYVQGRTKAGGWSQQRYARRRDNQARHVYGAAADLAALIWLPQLESLDAVVTGGDRPAVDSVLADQRLIPVVPLIQSRVHPVADPRLRVLETFPAVYLAVGIALNATA